MNQFFSSKNKTKDSYQARAKKYGRYIKTYDDPRLFLKMIESLRISVPLKVLDIGCGQGHSSKPFKILGMDIYFLDFSFAMISEGIKKKIIEKNKVIINDLKNSNLPLRSEVFDIAISRYTFHDIEKKAELLKEINRVLKSGGKFELVDMYSPSPELTEFYNELHRWKTKGTPLNNCWIIDEEKLAKDFERAGLTIIEKRRYTSRVNTIQWLKEDQIDEDRHSFLFNMVSEKIKQNPLIKEAFNIKFYKKWIKFDFPCIIIVGRKEK